MYLQLIHYYINNCRLPFGNFPSYIVAIYTCSMETTSREKAVRLAVINVGVIFIASFALPTHNGLANALDAPPLPLYFTPKRRAL